MCGDKRRQHNGVGKTPEITWHVAGLIWKRSSVTISAGCGRPTLGALAPAPLATGLDSRLVSGYDYESSLASKVVR